PVSRVPGGLLLFEDSLVTCEGQTLTPNLPAVQEDCFCLLCLLGTFEVFMPFAGPNTLAIVDPAGQDAVVLQIQPLTPSLTLTSPVASAVPTLMGLVGPQEAPIEGKQSYDTPDGKFNLLLSRLCGKARDVVKVSLSCRQDLCADELIDAVFDVLKRNFGELPCFNLPMRDFYNTVPRVESVVLVGCGGLLTQPRCIYVLNIEIYGLRFEVPTFLVPGQKDELIIGSNVLRPIIQKI
ncbi:hypothetical protein D4764_06G0006610, partial [Takifugu flavidus]